MLRKIVRCSRNAHVVFLGPPSFPRHHLGRDTGIWDLCRLRVSVGCGAFKASLFPWVGPRLLFNWLSMWDFVCDSLFAACGGWRWLVQVTLLLVGSWESGVLSVYIDASFSDPLPLAQLCAQNGVSFSTICCWFLTTVNTKYRKPELLELFSDLSKSYIPGFVSGKFCRKLWFVFISSSIDFLQTMFVTRTY